jgi:hypothetical protein
LLGHQAQPDEQSLNRSKHRFWYSGLTHIFTCFIYRSYLHAPTLSLFRRLLILQQDFLL